MTILVDPPLDPYSEVVDVNRRWTPDWYTWLSKAIKDISTGGNGGTVTTPNPAWVEPLGLFDYNIHTFPFSAFPLGVPTDRWNIAGFSIIPIIISFTAPGQMNWYLRSTPVYLWASGWNQDTLGSSSVIGANANAARALVTGVNVRCPVGQPIEFHVSDAGTADNALFRIILWGKDGD